jgi:hypothetical protein
VNQPHYHLLSVAEERKLFVGGLSWESGEPELAEYFGQYGEVESVNLKMDPNTGKSRCFAFIVYKAGAGLKACFEQSEHAINSKKVRRLFRARHKYDLARSYLCTFWWFHSVTLCHTHCVTVRHMCHGRVICNMSQISCHVS